MTVRIGITGPIGCGKSTVLAWLGELGATVIDADAIARDVVEPGGPALAAVLEAFGPGIRSPDGGLDRAALGRVVFRDPAALRRLETIVHPAVRQRILAALAAAEAVEAPAVAIEAIKLMEGGLAALCDEVWLVTCDVTVQRTRVIARGADPADADARIRAQGDLAARHGRVAARVIDTSGSLEDARAATADAYAAALTVARGRRP
ncbi:MAG: dephospho-CoA kinase [Chloroflexota bacterium]